MITALQTSSQYKYVGQQGNLGRNNRKRSKGKIRQIKKSLGQRQGKIYERLRASDDDGAGDEITKQKNVKVARFIHQNVRGLGVINNIENHSALQDLKDLDVDVIGLTETNVNWENPHERDKWRTQVQRWWPKSKVLMSVTPNGDRLSTFRQGGATMILSSKYSSMANESGEDKMGRWVWATVGHGKERVTIITIYRPCENNITTAGASTVWAQQRNYIQNELLAKDGPQNKIETVDPRDQATRDLDAFIESKQKDGGKIILMGDLNQDLSSKQKGKLSYGQVCERRGLYSAMYQHEENLKPSHIFGSKVIDHISVGGVMTESITGAGQLPHRTIFARSDHRPIFFDVNMCEVLNTKVEDLAERPRRKLVSKNKKRSGHYIKEVLERFKAQNVYQRTGKLIEKARKGQFTEADKDEYDRLDKIISEAMLTAERNLPGKKGMGWHPTLSKITYKIRYLRILRRKCTGFHISEKAVVGLSKKARTDFYSNDLGEINSMLKTTWKEFAEFKGKAQQARELHLTELLTESQMESDETRSKAIIELRKAEKRSRQQQRINRAAGKIKRGVRTVYVPDEKSDDGPWKMLSTKEEMEEAIIKQNVSHLEKAGETPFAHGEKYESLLNEFERDDVFEELLTGTSDWTHPVTEVEEWIKELKYQYDTETLKAEAKAVGNEMTYAEYRDHFRLKKEATESSKSGRHMGHYRAGLSSPEISEIHLHMINIPLLCGFSGTRWKKSIAVMVAKDQGMTKINRMRIIQLLEADLNAVLGCVFGRRMVGFAVKHCSINESQFGRPGTLCQSAVLNKVLSFDISRLIKQDTAAMEVDAEGCYDRMVPELVAITCRRLGMPLAPCHMLIDVLNNMEHCVRTQLGQTTKEYRSELGKRLFGTGQGSGGSPAFWLTTSETILNAMTRNTDGYNVSNPNGNIVHKRIEDKFIDDASLMTNGDNSRQAVEKLATNSQKHERYLFSTGGRLALHKCFWTLMTYQWTNGKAEIVTYDERRAKQTTTEDNAIRLTQGGDFSKKYVIKRIGASTAYRTLGVFLAANGSQKKQKEVLQDKSEKWSIKMRNSNLTNEEKLMSYVQQLMPSLTYPLPCTMMTKEELRRVQYPSLKVAINAMGLNSSYPRCILFGDHRYQGLGMTDLYTQQGQEKIRYYVGHIRTRTDTARLLRIEKDYVELLSGRGRCPLEHPEVAMDTWLPRTWIQQLGQFLHECDGSIETEGERVIGQQRQNDHNIMDCVDHMSASEKDKIQQCRLFLRVQSVADISTADGKRIEKDFYDGKRCRDSVLQWPTQGRPHKRAWKAWRRLIQQFVKSGTMDLRDTYKLGTWTSTHQKWQWKGCHKIVTKTEDGSVYRARGGGRRPTGVRASRGRVGEVYPADVVANNDGTVKINYVQQVSRQENEDSDHGTYQRIMGRIRECSDLRVVPEGCTKIIGVSDGSVKNGEGSAGYVIHATGQDERTIEASLPVDGSAETMNSYRAELQGLLAMQLTTKTLASHSHKNFSCDFYLDNKEAVTKINAVDETYPVSIKQALDEEHDLIYEIKKIRDELPVPSTVQWVKGHVRHPTCIPEHLNNHADWLANEHRKQPWEHRGRSNSAKLPTQPVQVRFGGTSYHGKYSAAAKRHLFGCDAEEFMIKKFNIPPAAMLDIDWEIIGKMMKNLPSTERAKKSKFTYRWNFTKKRGCLLKEEENETCPLCGNAPETNEHVLRCCNEMVEENREVAMEAFRKKLRSIGTHEDMVRLMCAYVEDDGPTVLHDVRNVACEDQFHDLVTRQSLIGDRNWEIGWWSKAWSYLHDKLRRSGHRTRYKGEGWAVRAQGALWEYVRSQWEFRNGLVHGRDEDEERKIARLRLEEKVRDVYGEENNVGRRTNLFKEPVEEMFRKGDQYLEDWIRSVRVAVRVEERRRLRKTGTRNTMWTWLRPHNEKTPLTTQPIVEITKAFAEMTLLDTG